HADHLEDRALAGTGHPDGDDLHPVADLEVARGADGLARPLDGPALVDLLDPADRPVLGADDRGVAEVVVTLDPDGEGPLPDATGRRRPLDAADLRLEGWGDDAALQGSLPVGAVDDHRCRLLPQRTDERGDEPGLDR